MENYERFEQLLAKRSFKELSAEEKKLAEEFVHSEEEYESLRHTSLQLTDYFQATNHLRPNPQGLRKIKSKLAESSPKFSKSYWIQTSVPAYVMLLLLVGVGSICWYAGSNFHSTDQVIGKETTNRIDTVFVAVKADTVVRERIIYLKQEAQLAPSLQVSSTTMKDLPASKGVTMKEKEELENLLVSGSM